LQNQQFNSSVRMYVAGSNSSILRAY